MSLRTVRIIVAAAFIVVVGTGVLAVIRARALLDNLTMTPDPACVSQGIADNDKLANEIASLLPSTRPDDMGGRLGCEPDEAGAWIEAELPNTSIEDAMRSFVPPAWTPVSAREAQEQAEPGETVLGVTGEINDRQVRVFASQSRSWKGPVRVAAWFLDD
ncbi:hypothetical protein [Sphaerisporangium sp. NPDC051011]|uniref:hypothetical protein n=1 Tax=Sphaerisporangium sp. NPDC051011 TaxID=3155792 RepID=UPI0034113130